MLTMNLWFWSRNYCWRVLEYCEPLQVHFEHFIEHRRGHRNPCHAQAFEDLRSHAGAAESALHLAGVGHAGPLENEDVLQVHPLILDAQHLGDAHQLDRKSTRLNSSHSQIS